MQYNPNGRGAVKVELNPNEFKPADYLRISRMARELWILDQIYSPDVQNLLIVSGGPAPAWTTFDGDEISFAMDKMPMPTGKLEVAIWMGTNAHELGHSKWSPKKNSPLMVRLIDADRLFHPGILNLHNIVEDQREERFLLGRFNPYRPYLVAALSYHLKMDRNAWALFTGRTWLSDQVREAARAEFVKARGESTTKEVSNLVGRYQRLADPGTQQSNEAYKILEELHQLFELDIPRGGCGHGEGHGDSNGDGQPEDVPIDDLPPTADEAEGDGKSKGKAKGKGEQSNDKQSDGEPSDGESGDPKSDADPNGAGDGGDQTPPPFDPSKVKDQMRQDARDDLNQNPDSKADLGNILDALDYGRGDIGDIEAEEPNGELIDATDAASRLRRDLSTAFLDFQAEIEPGWVKRTNRGKLRAGRVLNPHADPNEWFDKYSPGQMEATELETVVLLDVSGSMRHQMAALSEAAWAIHHAVDDIEGTATILTFSSGTRVLANPGKHPTKRMWNLQQWGGTNPTDALRQAYFRLASSKKRNRLLVVLTDGEWGGIPNVNPNDQLIAGMREIGITTVLAFLPTGASDAGTPSAHGCEHFRVIKTPGDFAILFRDVAMAEMKSAK